MNELAVVMPVYNEADCIQPVIRSWLVELDRLSIDYVLYAMNDGSKDGTGEALDAWSGDTRVRVIHKTNEGHGPTILRGYAMACPGAKWVFQTDSDDEIAAGEMLPLWLRRDEGEFLLGERVGRAQSPGRRTLSMGSRSLLRLMCGAAIPRDTNVPFRLMQSEALARILPLFPSDTFAPNVAISGLAALSGARVVTMPVRHRERETGQTSLPSWKLLRVACRSMIQTHRILRQYRRSR